MLAKLQSAVSLFTCGCLVSLAASPSNVGFVITGGEAQVDGSAIRGNSTLFQGSVVRSGNSTSDLMFPGGSNLLLQPETAVRVYREYAVLEKGTATQRGSRPVFADGLRVSSLSPLGAVVVGVKDASHLEVTAQSGAAEVRNPAGAVVARLEAGKVLSFAIQAPPATEGQSNPPPETVVPQTAASADNTPIGPQVTIHGLLRKDHAGRYGHFLLTDLATNVTYELQGSGLDDLVGGSVEVTGSLFDTKAAEGASKVMSVSDIHQMPLSEMGGTTTASTPAGGTPTPTGDTPPANGAGPEVGATPEATAPPEVSTAPTTPEPPPLPVHTDTGKIILIVALAAGAGVGVALGLAGGKSSTVSPE
jgi:hypothetical protein